MPRTPAAKRKRPAQSPAKQKPAPTQSEKVDLQKRVDRADELAATVIKFTEPKTEREIPEWVGNTYPDLLYLLTIFENSDAGVEEIEMSRVEYIALVNTG
jgi:hypothetical protein